MTLPLFGITYNNTSYHLVKLSLLAASLLAIIYLSAPKLSLPSLSVINHYQCDVKGSLLVNESFEVLLPIADSAEKFANSLCHDARFAEHYSSVKVTWKKRSEISPEDLVQDKYHLLWGRHQTLIGLSPNIDQHYYSVVAAQPIPLFWLSKQGPITLTPEFLTNKTIGLLDEQKSYSGYLLPISSLKLHGIDVAKLTIQYYPSYRALYSAFEENSIDLISAGEWATDMFHMDNIHKLAIEYTADTGEMYLMRSLSHSEIKCSVFNSLSNAFSSLYAIKTVNDSDGICHG